QVAASATLMLGDDVTDEDAFALLSGPDVSVKAGPGETCAKYRVADTVEVARLLARLAEGRAAWMAGSHAVPIQQMSLLSDHRAVALVGPNGRVIWYCAPRLDSTASFAELLGGPAAGFFEVRPPDDSLPAGQRYVGDSFVLETTWPGFKVYDYF